MTGPLIPDGGEQRDRLATLAVLAVLILAGFCSILGAVLASVFGAWT